MGVFIAGKSVKAVRKKVEAGIVAIVLLALSFFLSCYHLTMGIMWFVTALIGVAAVILISQLINENTARKCLRKLCCWWRTTSMAIL